MTESEKVTSSQGGLCRYAISHGAVAGDQDMLQGPEGIGWGIPGLENCETWVTWFCVNFLG